MALWRSGARSAPRHTGREYGRGFQFRNPDRLTLDYGPWDSVWPLGDRDLPKNVLLSLKDGILVDGIIFPIWARSSAIVADEIVVSADEMSIVGDRYRIVFVQDGASADVLKAYYDNGVASGSDLSAITIGTDRISMTPWQRYVYFVSPSLGLVRRYSPIDNAFVTVASSPTNGKFAFILNNNLVIIRKNGDVWEAVWSVDSLPEDFAGAGSGAAVLTGIGEPRGFGIINDRAIIIGAAGAKVMVPTGGLPAFAFQDITSIEGTPFDYAVSASQDELFFFGYDYQLRMFRDGSIRAIGEGEGRLLGTPLLYYSRRLGKLIVTLQGEDKTLFLDVDTGKWVSNLDISWDFMTDSPVVDATGRVIGYENGAGHTSHTLDLEPVGLFTLPRISFGIVTLPQEFVVEYVDVKRTNKNSPQPLAMTFGRTLQSDMIQDDVFDITSLVNVQEIGERLRYHINKPAASFRTDMHVADTSSVLLPGPFLLTLQDGLGNIPVNPLNPPSGVRGDIDLLGNMDIDASTTEYFSSQNTLDAEGNLDLELASQNEWLRDTGIIGLAIRLKKQSLEEV